MLDKEFEFLTVHVDQMMKFLGVLGGLCAQICAIVFAGISLSCPFLPKCLFTSISVEKWALLGRKISKGHAKISNFSIDFI